MRRRDMLKLAGISTVLGGSAVLSSCSKATHAPTLIPGIPVLGIVLYDQFEILDVMGPLQLLSMIPEKLNTILLGPDAGPVASRGGYEVMAQYSWNEAPPVDIVLVPGSKNGTKSMLNNREFITWLKRYAQDCSYITSVCTGSGILAQAGLLDGYSATTNKRAFSWISEAYPQVKWQGDARWVEDGNRWTSSGVSAGTDMMAAFISMLFGAETENAIIQDAELIVDKDPHNDSFSVES